MGQRLPLREIRERTYKTRDAWWTVLLVDPLAVRLVRLVAPYRRITPNVLTGIATLVGLASAACFAMQDRPWLVAGALLFHLSFVIDCMDGKIARLNGTGSLFGAWYDFVFDRLRMFACTVALMGGQYAKTGEPVYLWILVAVTFLDLFRYLNGSQMAKVRRAMRVQLDDARGLPRAAEVTGQPDQWPDNWRARLRATLRRYRIRPHLVSGIEFEMAVCIIAPLTGWIVGVPIVAGVLLMGFEFLLVAKLWRATRKFPRQLAKVQAAHGVRDTAPDAPRTPAQEGIAPTADEAMRAVDETAADENDDLEFTARS
ncbi:CDP-alcohol phosphatidyltransferase-like enzyme [Krasilnikovia cinnamomea]|uniref:CDP-alcohol phosphatidyltransferase-like enzyme n=1 Tax=Krasilnikovia cinnamomea TaxID=349313 RepID=A0A4Q7ZFI0_9ACTN|nr:CDP-alcohol phosphatidyltransferase family protein [Krasilnikovia cinnamomea]RZU49532.1 CDP-alcohol phosphatidyltransferase-like enzyme [Krasilnikovia cinnamomea]